MTDAPAAVSPPSADAVEAAALGALTSRLTTAVALLASASPFSSRGLWPHPAGEASLLLLLLLRLVLVVAVAVEMIVGGRYAAHCAREAAAPCAMDEAATGGVTLTHDLLLVPFSAAPAADAWQDVHVRVTAEPLGPPGVPRAFRVTLKAEPGRGLPSEAAVLAAFVSSVFSGRGFTLVHISA